MKILLSLTKANAAALQRTVKRGNRNMVINAAIAYYLEHREKVSNLITDDLVHQHVSAALAHYTLSRAPAPTALVKS